MNINDQQISLKKIFTGPLFEGSHIAARLDESDAEFVDVIHSNGENLILGGLGSWQPMVMTHFFKADLTD